MSRLTIIVSVMTAVFLLSCGSGNIAGNSSETTNGLIVVARAGKIEGTAPPLSSLYLFEDSYSPFSGVPFDSMKTDTTGAFSFSAPESGYNLFCHGKNGLRSSIHLVMNAVSMVDDTILDTLSLPGSVDGYTTSAADMRRHNSYLYLEGTPFFTVADSTSGYFRIDGIPEGRYIVRFFDEISIDYSILPPAPDTLSRESTKIIIVKSDSVLTVDWKW